MTNDSDRNRDDITEMNIDPPAPSISLSVNAILKLLTHHHRRDLLRFLRDGDDQTATVDEIVTDLVTREAQRTGRQPGRDQIETTLHHIHLPKLAEAGIVEHDARSRCVRYWPHNQVEDFLEHIQSANKT